MLNEKAYINVIPGVWETFERERPRLNLQEIDQHFSEESGLPPDMLKAGFYALRDSLSGKSPVIRKAKLFEYLLINGRISVDSEDWFANKIDHQNLMDEYNKTAMSNVPALYISDVRDSMDTARSTGYYHTSNRASGYFENGIDTGHTSPGWRYMYSKGLSGILLEAKKFRNNYGNNLTPEQADFYNALEIVYNAIIVFAERLSDMAVSLVHVCDDASGVRLLSIADSLKNVPSNPPKDFHEALQFTFIMHQMIEIEGELVRSMGGFDRNFIKYYESDIQNKRLTPDRVKELIKFFFTKFYAHTRGASNGKNFYFGGQYHDGSNAENELTYLTLEAYSEMNTTDPKLSVRFYKNSTERLYKQVAEIIRAGRTAFVLANDEIAIPAILAQGKTLEEAREYLLIGCYEPTIEGKEISCNMALAVNLAKGIELVMNRGVDIETKIRIGPDTGDPAKFESYENFENAYTTQLHAQIDKVTSSYREYEFYWPLMNPSPVLAGTFEDALKRGRDIGQSGPKYNNTGCMGTGLGSTVDSLASIKKAVFEDKMCSMQEMVEAIHNNFVGYEKLRLYLLNRTPRWGNADPLADAIAKRIVDVYCSHVNTVCNGRGGKYMPSIFSLEHRYSFGSHTSALPNGRGKSEPLSLNNAATPGKDTEGVTALIHSLTCLDYKKIPNGSVTDVYLHPSAISGDDGLNAFISLIKMYFSKGGFGLQFNIFDKDTLLDAQKYPEKYQTLQIRVCGWNVYFVTMSAFEQEQYINMNIHAI